jgi:hypothetical protein
LTYRAQEQLSALAKARGDGKISDDQFDRQYLEIYNAAMGSGATEVMQSVTIESRVQVTLAAPLFDGTIAPVADEVQVFDATHTSGKWEWQLKPNTPDTYQLPLVLRIYDPTGKEVLAEGQILNVTVNVPYTASYGINKVWTEVAAFFTSLQGVIASIGAIAAGTAGFRAWDVHRAKRKKVPEPKPEPEAGPTSGYLWRKTASQEVSSLRICSSITKRAAASCSGVNATRLSLKMAWTKKPRTLPRWRMISLTSAGRPAAMAIQEKLAQRSRSSASSLASPRMASPVT